VASHLTNGADAAPVHATAIFATSATILGDAVGLSNVAAGADHEQKQKKGEDDDHNAVEAKQNNNPFRRTVGKGSISCTIIKVHVGIEHSGNKLLEHNHDNASRQENLEGAPPRRI